ncbi:MAG: diguanylate cyclase [Desulfobulbaceae bacterium]|nr:diguanylate cyclase [Desulfobulbaceae bacterium]
MTTDGRQVRTAMIVEDEPVARLLLEKGVRRLGYEVTVHGSGEDAWQRFLVSPPRLVLVDWGLPGMDGIALCEKIRATPQGRYVAILMVTARAEPEDMEKAILAGADFFMPKGVTPRMARAWIAVADKRMHDLLILEENERHRHQLHEELAATNFQLEEAIGRANRLAMEAEQAYIELNQIFKTVAGGIVLIDGNYRLLRCNDAFLHVAGISREEAPGSLCYQVFPSSLCRTNQCPMVRIKGGAEYVENEIAQPQTHPRSGPPCHYHIISSPFRGPAGDLIGIVEHVTDISKRVEAEEALKKSENRYRELSIVDELTRLFNKRYLNTNLPLEIERARRHNHPLALLLLDIDNFKLLNDTYGHAEGDKVLARLGAVIFESVRMNDIACRYGGEEFVVILPETTGEQATVVAERVRLRFKAERFEPRAGEQLYKTISIGVAQYLVGESEEELVKRADVNMYAAKKEGKDRFVLR